MRFFCFGFLFLHLLSFLCFTPLPMFMQKEFGKEGELLGHMQVFYLSFFCSSRLVGFFFSPWFRYLFFRSFSLSSIWPFSFGLSSGVYFPSQFNFFGQICCTITPFFFLSCFFFLIFSFIFFLVFLFFPFLFFLEKNPLLYGGRRKK